MERRKCSTLASLLLFSIPILLFTLSSCATIPRGEGAPAAEQREKRAEIVRYTRSLLGKKDIGGEGAEFRNDCSGLVLGVFDRLGYDVELSHVRPGRPLSDSIYRSLNARGHTYVSYKPRTADLAFFKGTVDGGGDSVTHVGIVDEIHSDGTIVILNFTSIGVSELRMNLRFPDVHRDAAGRVLNDFLRKKSSDLRFKKLLSGELFFSFGDFVEYSLSNGGGGRDFTFE